MKLRYYNGDKDIFNVNSIIIDQILTLILFVTKINYSLLVLINNYFTAK